MRGAIDPRAFRQRDRLLEVVPVLPVPVETGHFEEDLRLARGEHRAVLEVLAASVHVRMQAGELDVRAHFEARIDAIVRITRRNPERVVDGRQREDALFRRLFGEDDTKPRAIGPRMAVRRVVHLEHDVGAGLDELSLPGLENLRRLARCVADQKIAGQRAGFRLFIRTDLRRREEDAGRLASGTTSISARGRTR